MTFEEIYANNRVRIVQYLARLVGDTEAEDLAQEVFVKVNRGLAEFRDEAHVNTWVYKIATNAALDRLRSPSFKTVEPVEDIELVSLQVGPKGPTAEQQAIKEEMGACVRGMVDRLPATYRTAIVLSQLEGFKDSEVAEILGVKLSAAKITLHRARKRLKKVLSENCVFYHNEENELACDRMPGNKLTEIDEQQQER